MPNPTFPREQQLYTHAAFKAASYNQIVALNARMAATATTNKSRSTEINWFYKHNIGVLDCFNTFNVTGGRTAK